MVAASSSLDDDPLDRCSTLGVAAGGRERRRTKLLFNFFFFSYFHVRSVQIVFFVRTASGGENGTCYFVKIRFRKVTFE